MTHDHLGPCVECWRNGNALPIHIHPADATVGGVELSNPQPERIISMAERVLSTTRRGFRFTWHGGEYIEIAGPGTGGPFEVINTSRGDGSLPEFTLSNFELELAGVDYNELRHSAREHNLGRPAAGGGV